MTDGTTVAATDPDRLHAAVNAAARRLYDAETAGWDPARIARA
jgi:hypothetical protein